MYRRSVLLAVAAAIVPAAACSVPAASAAAAAGAVSAAAAQPTVTKVAGYLSGVAAISDTDAWAVGDFASGSTEYPLTMRWTGTAWQKVASPRLAGGSLTAVAMTSASNAWAVGTTTSPTTGGTQSLILHWTGSAWAQVPSPNPAASVTLSGVAAAPGGTAWAVGSYSTKTATRTLILRWNGTAWARVASPSPGKEPGLRGVTVLSARSAWAVGGGCGKTCNAFRTLILHWNGRTWKRVASPSPGFGGSDLGGVSATSARNAWAVGSIIGCGCGSDGPVILHWNGKTWKSVHVPNPTGGAALAAVAASSARSAFAVGSLPTRNFPYRNSFIVAWNGKTWKQVASPSLGKKEFSNLNDLAVVSSRFGLAVGGKLSLRWNGKSWS